MTPFWRPDPLTSEIDSEGKPSVSSSPRIGSKASWRMYASIFFMRSRPRRLRLADGPARRDALWLAVQRRDRRADHGRPIRPVPEQLGLRDELLRVAVHAVLGDVQARLLGLGVDAQADRLLDRPERADGEHEHGDERGGHADRLDPELLEGARVEQAGLADAVELGQPRGREQAAGQRAPD